MKIPYRITDIIKIQEKKILRKLNLKKKICLINHKQYNTEQLATLNMYEALSNRITKYLYFNKFSKNLN